MHEGYVRSEIDGPDREVVDELIDEVNPGDHDRLRPDDVFGSGVVRENVILTIGRQQGFQSQVTHLFAAVHSIIVTPIRPEEGTPDDVRSRKQTRLGSPYLDPVLGHRFQ